MPIMNTVIKGSGGSGTVPDYYLKRVVDGNGKIILDSSQTTVSTSPATDVDNLALHGWVSYTSKSVGVDCSSLTAISGQGAFQYAFCGSQGITTYDFSNVTTISGQGAFDSAWTGIYSGATSISFPNLIAITGANAFASAFSNNSAITTVTFGNTAQITFGTNPFGGWNFDGMFNYCYQNITVNAPLANKAEIEAMTGYPNFGAGGTVTWNWVS